MSVLAEVQAYNLIFAQQYGHTAHGEGVPEDDSESVLYLERLSEANAPTQSNEIRQFKFYDRAFDGTRLPPDVTYEIRIPEDALTADDLQRVSSLTLETPLATTRYSIERIHCFPPFAECRLWRLGVTAKEDEE